MAYLSSWPFSWYVGVVYCILFGEEASSDQPIGRLCCCVMLPLISLSVDLHALCLDVHRMAAACKGVQAFACACAAVRALAFKLASWHAACKRPASLHVHLHVTCMHFRAHVAENLIADMTGHRPTVPLERLRGLFYNREGTW